MFSYHNNLFAVSICTNLSQVFRHRRTTQPNVPFAKRADITSSLIQLSQVLGPCERTGLLGADAFKTWAFFIKLILSETICRATVPRPGPSQSIRLTSEPHI